MKTPLRTITWFAIQTKIPLAIQTIQPVMGFVADNTDCDDTSDQINIDWMKFATKWTTTAIDEDTATDAPTWFADADEDTFGDPNNTTLACEQPNGFVADNTDCDDINNMVNTSIVEVCMMTTATASSMKTPLQMHSLGSLIQMRIPLAIQTIRP